LVTGGDDEACDLAVVQVAESTELVADGFPAGACAGRDRSAEIRCTADQLGITLLERGVRCGFGSVEVGIITAVESACADLGPGVFESPAGTVTSFDGDEVLIKVVTSGAHGSNAMPAELLQAIVETAHQQDLPVAAHAHFQLDQLARCIDLEVDTIEHGFLLHRLAGAFEQMAARRIALCPTLRVIESIRAAPGWHGQRLIPNAWQDAIDTTRAAFDAGVPLLAGTDSGVFEVSPIDVWREVELIAHATGSRWEGLRAATSTAARYLRQPGLGTLSPGATGDLIVLDADPLQVEVGPANVRAVFQGGTLVSGDLEAVAVA
jgi:hypothetical protein